MHRDFPGGPDSELLLQGARLIPVWGTKIPHAALHNQKKKVANIINK